MSTDGAATWKQQTILTPGGHGAIHDILLTYSLTGNGYLGLAVGE